MGKILVKVNKQRIACAEKEAYVTRPVHFTTIQSEDLLKAAARNSGINKAVIYSGLMAIMNEFQNFLFNGHAVQVPELGTFRVGINAKAVETEEEVSTDSVYRRKIIYTPTTELRHECNNLQVTAMQNDVLTVVDDIRKKEEEEEPNP